ncbi:hypothetical protein H4R35_004914 [Dimargaris xerosporica]|nr:hypothetical protein H4R35_004914 [Dimargaris xerosporica]
MDAQEASDVRRGTAQFLQNKAIIYIVFTALYVVFVVATTVLFVLRTRSARYRPTKLMVIQTFGTLSLSIVSGLSNALQPYWPCFISLWGLYLGITLWLFGFVARILRLLFQSEIHQAKLHVTALHPDSEAYLQASGGNDGFGAQCGAGFNPSSAASLPPYPSSAPGPRAAMELNRPRGKADWDQVLERNELKSTPMVQKRYPFGRMLDNISWARKSWWFSERILIRVFIGLVLIVVAYLVTVQTISPTMRIDPVSTRCNSKWEYILMYILMSLHVLVFCPLMTYWLRGMHDAYGLRRDLVIEVMVAAISYVLYLITTHVFGTYDIYFSSSMFLFIGSGIVHFIGVVIPLWKTYKQPAPDTLPDDYDMYDDSEDQDSLAEPKERPQSEDFNLARSIKRISYGYTSGANGTGGPLTPIRKLQGPPSADPTKASPDHAGNNIGPASGGGGSYGRAAAGRIGAPTSQSRWNSFVNLLQSPTKFEQFKYYAAACFCTELTLFLEDYQQLKSRVYPCYKPHERRSRPATPPSPIDPSLPVEIGLSPPNVARRRSVQTQSPKAAAATMSMNDGISVGKPHAPVEWAEGSKRPTLRVFTDQGGEPLPDKGQVLSCSPHSTTFSPALTDQLHDEVPSGAHITIYDTIGPIYRPLKLAYNPGQDQFLPQRMTLVKHPPVPQHLKSLFYSFYNRYIDPNSVLAINMPGPYVKEVANNIRDQSYTITMFDTAHREVLNMLYDNVYPRYLKMRRASRIRSKV